MKGVLLAAGKGKRLLPITEEIPKPMVLLRDKPLIDYVVEGFRSAGVEELFIVVSYLSNQIVDYVQDGSKWGLRVEYGCQEEALGTAHAALVAEEWVGRENFLFGWSDVLSPHRDYAGIRECHWRDPCDALIAVNYVEGGVHHGGAVCLNGEGCRVVMLVEKPPHGMVETEWSQAGLFMLTPDIFHYLHQVPLSPRGEYEFTSAMQAMVEDGRRVLAYQISGPRLHITSPDCLKNADSILEQIWP